MKLGTHVYLVYITVLKWLELKIIVIFLKLRAKLPFLGFLSIFVTFPHELAQTLFVLHEISYTTLSGLYYFVETVRIENHGRMLEITC